MKKSLIALVVFCSVVILSVTFSTQNQVKTVEPVTADKSETDTVTETRLLNMLNHNFVYGNDFDDASAMVNRSLGALVDYKNADDNFINASFVTDFVSNMYGVDVVDFSNLNCNAPKKDGFIFMNPCGFTSYKHSEISIHENEDGTISATTKVTVLSHDANEKTYTASSLFVKNENSAFGYNIIYSEILDNSPAM